MNGECPKSNSDAETFTLLPPSNLYTLRSTESAGRGVFACQNIPNGTLLFRTSPPSVALENSQPDSDTETDMPICEILSPTAHVILRPYRREVCAECFRYDRGREWKIRLDGSDGDAGLVLCSTECRDLWMTRFGEVGRLAFCAVEGAVKKFGRRKGKDGGEEERKDGTEGQESGSVASGPSEEDIQSAWESVARVGERVLEARSSDIVSKAGRKVLRVASEPDDIDADILYFLLTGTLNAHITAKARSKRAREPQKKGHTQDQDLSQQSIENSSDMTITTLTSLQSLIPDQECYSHPSTPLPSYTTSHLLLLTLLPTVLTPYLTPSTSHNLCIRASHNAFSIRPANTTDGTHSGEFLGWGIWPEASFFNHSCGRNVDKERKGRVWEFRTGRDVREGEELCISYLGGDEDELGVEERRKRLFEGWGFRCGCLRCVEEAATQTGERKENGES